MTTTLLARLAELLPRVADVHGRDLWQPRRATSFSDANDLWYGAASFAPQPRKRSRQCCTVGIPGSGASLTM